MCIVSAGRECAKNVGFLGKVMDGSHELQLMRILERRQRRSMHRTEATSCTVSTAATTRDDCVQPELEKEDIPASTTVSSPSLPEGPDRDDRVSEAEVENVRSPRLLVSSVDHSADACNGSQWVPNIITDSCDVPRGSSSTRRFKMMCTDTGSHDISASSRVGSAHIRTVDHRSVERLGASCRRSTSPPFSSQGASNAPEDLIVLRGGLYPLRTVPQLAYNTLAPRFDTLRGCSITVGSAGSRPTGCSCLRLTLPQAPELPSGPHAANVGLSCSPKPLGQSEGLNERSSSSPAAVGSSGTPQNVDEASSAMLKKAGGDEEHKHVSSTGTDGVSTPALIAETTSPGVIQQVDGSIAAPREALSFCSASELALSTYVPLSSLCAGEWFYKWSGKALSSVRRWVWVDVVNLYIHWAHWETFETTFAKKMKLTHIVDVHCEGPHGSESAGNTRSGHGSDLLYTLLVQTSRRQLKICSEVRSKVEGWCKGLRELLSHLKLPSSWAAPSVL
uniref:Pleckstrin homology domain-containing protein n=1 Tax=Trypanosoma congolense (strain IL3000) TaxID=1068625 RepID=G0UJI6_TRYCI|nr:conserved hypothetical protein [Trypanosoma congolense IL3000]